MKKDKSEIEIHPVIVETKIRKCLNYNLELNKSFCAFYASIRFALFLKENNFLFCLQFLI